MSDRPDVHPLDDIGRAKSITLTVWMALRSNDFIENGGVDAVDISETLYEVFERLCRAEKSLEANA